jgi:FkbM family methyltransferase
MHSQNLEEQFITDYYGQSTGRLLDIGAYDGETFSNTYALIDQGWSGVMVEASPQVFVALQRKLKGFKVELLNTCITTGEETLIDFYDNGGAVATPNVANFKKWEKHAEFEKIHVMSMHYARIIEKFGADFDMVNIDVEGGSTDLFLALYDIMPQVSLWCVEHDGNYAQIKAKASGLTELHRNGENIILAKV